MTNQRQGIPSSAGHAPEAAFGKGTSPSSTTPTDGSAQGRPLVTFLLVAYNQERFVREALQGAFSQTYSPLRIVFSDDCSTDRTFEIAKEIVGSYEGPHTCVMNRNAENLGLAGNINSAFKAARGDFIVIAAGDDISTPDRTSLLVDRWLQKESPVDLVCSYFAEIDETSKPTGFIKTAVTFTSDVAVPVHKWRFGATGACAGYSRRLFDKYGPLRPKVVAEDAVFPFRAWLERGIGLVEKPLVNHRTHSQSLGVLHRSVDKEPSRERRRQLRRQSAEGALAIAEDYLHSWQVADKKDPAERVAIGLRRLVRLRGINCRAFESSRFEALQLALLSLGLPGGGWQALRLILRHVLRHD